MPWLGEVHKPMIGVIHIPWMGRVLKPLLRKVICMIYLDRNVCLNFACKFSFLISSEKCKVLKEEHKD